MTTFELLTLTRERRTLLLKARISGLTETLNLIIFPKLLIGWGGRSRESVQTLSLGLVSYRRTIGLGIERL